MVTPWGNKVVAWRKRYCKEQCQVHAGEEGHARPGWTTSRRGQDCPWKSQSEWQRTGINGECTSMVWTTLGSRTAKEQNTTAYSEITNLPLRILCRWQVDTRRGNCSCNFPSHLYTTDHKGSYRIRRCLAQNNIRHHNFLYNKYTTNRLQDVRFKLVHQIFVCNKSKADNKSTILDLYA